MEQNSDRAKSKLPQLREAIMAEADRCIRCGLCLNHCPTYVMTRNECESPRGRIALIRNLATQELALTDKTKTYLDHCLTCRSCEQVCPAEVHYGRLIDQGRELISLLDPTIKLPSLTNFIILRPRLIPWLGKVLRFYQRSGLQWLARRLKLLSLLRLKRQDRYLLPLNPQQPLKPFYPASTVIANQFTGFRFAALEMAALRVAWERAFFCEPASKKAPPMTGSRKANIRQQRGHVALFLGCISRMLDITTLHDSIRVLTACGFNVNIPKQQVCCGALHLHAGLHQTTQQLSAQNQHAFNKKNYTAIITTSTACQSVLQENALQEIVNPDPMHVPYKDIHTFLQEITWPTQLALQPLPQRVLLHTPCSMQTCSKKVCSTQKDPQQVKSPLHLLQKIPDLEVIEFDYPHCCGAAGNYMLQHPQMADALVDALYTHIKGDDFHYFATTNIGCRLHIARKLREKKTKIAIIHPISLLARQLYSNYAKKM